MVKHLKVASVILQQVIAGNKIPDLTSLGPRISRTKSGLPRFIPSYQRKLIREGNPMVIRYWASVFSIYRDLHYTGALKLKTITDSSSATSSAFEVKKFISSFTTLCWSENDHFFSSKAATLSQILTSGPQSKRMDGEYNSHPNVIMKSLKTFMLPENKALFSSLLNILDLTCNVKLQYLLDWFQSPYSPGRKALEMSTPTSPYLGRLAIKEEAAGKVRLFAMVDPLTQWALKPLHKKLFSVLKRLPMDGTFNQLKPLFRVPFGSTSIYSFDLSAATDRLPL